MATTTPRLGLRKPETTDFVDVQLDIAENMQKLDDQFDPAGAGAHTHDGANSKQISHNDLLDTTTGDPHTQYMLKGAAGVVTDENIGNRTVDPTQTPVGNTGKLGQFLNWLVNRIKAITGATNWYDAPATTLAAAKAHMDNKTNPHSVTAAQVGALASVDGVANPGGNVDLVAGGAITLTPDNGAAKKVTISETHSTRTDNPHGVTAAQAGAIANGAGSVTDTNIGNRTVSDTTAPSGDTGTLTTLLGWLGNMIKAITGGATWRTAPVTTLSAAKAHMDSTSNPHGVTAAQVGALPSTGGTVSGDLTADGGDISVNRTGAGNVHYWLKNDGLNRGLIYYDATNKLMVFRVYATDGSYDSLTIDEAGVVKTNSNVVWHAGNDGAGSGLDADKLDGMEPTASATVSTVVSRDAAGRAKVAAPSAADDIARKDTVDGLKISENSWTQRQTFQAGIQDGDSNSDVSLVKSVQHYIDTRTTTITWSGGVPTSITDGVKTVNITWSGGVPTVVAATAGGVTSTSTITWSGGVPTTITKS